MAPSASSRGRRRRAWSEVHVPHRRHVAPAAARTVPNLGTLNAVYAELRSLPHVQGCFVGFKRTKGRKTRRLAIICCVDQKVGSRQLAARHRVPSRLTWKHGRTFDLDIETDVQEFGRSELQASPVAGPGDHLLYGAANPAQATAGVALLDKHLGPVITTVAHAVVNGPVEVTYLEDAPGIRLVNAGTAAGPLAGRIRRVVWNDTSDYALVSLGNARPTNLFDDSLLVRGPYWPIPEDVGKAVFTLTSRGVFPMHYEGAWASISVGGYPVESALLAEPLSAAARTLSGDSGCCLVDDEFRLWGLLVGITTVQKKLYSVFQSPAGLFKAGARLI